jgi:hypothetical protein
VDVRAAAGERRHRDEEVRLAELADHGHAVLVRGVHLARAAHERRREDDLLPDAGDVACAIGVREAGVALGADVLLVVAHPVVGAVGVRCGPQEHDDVAVLDVVVVLGGALDDDGELVYLHSSLGAATNRRRPGPWTLTGYREGCPPPQDTPLAPRHGRTVAALPRRSCTALGLSSARMMRRASAMLSLTMRSWAILKKEIGEQLTYFGRL